MRIAPTTPLRTLVVLALTLLLAAGCGGSSDSDAGGDDSSTGGVSGLAHVDGVIEATDDGLTVTPKDGGEARTFTAGPALERSAIMALAASGEPARVTYREGESVAAAVVPAPKVGEGVEAVEGLVVSVDESTLVIKGDDGERTFDITGAEAAAFDLDHLQDHADKAEPIRVYFRSDAPDAGVAYEDA